MGMHKPRSEYDDSPEPRRSRYAPSPDKPAWSPPTPPVSRLPGWHRPQTSEPTPDEAAALAAQLAALKAKLAGAAVPSGRALDPEHVRRYLERCAAKKATS